MNDGEMSTKTKRKATLLENLGLLKENRGER